MQADCKPEFRGFFEHLANGKLAFPFCEACNRWHWYPMTLCPHCRSDRIIWREVDPTGRIWSWTSVRHPFDASFGDRVPYIVALLTFDEAPGVRLVASIKTGEDLRIGMPVELVPPTGGEIADATVFRPVRGQPR